MQVNEKERDFFLSNKKRKERKKEKNKDRE
jgi:hypothetical protein